MIDRQPHTIVTRTCFAFSNFFFMGCCPCITERKSLIFLVFISQTKYASTSHKKPSLKRRYSEHLHHTIRTAALQPEPIFLVQEIEPLLPRTEGDQEILLRPFPGGLLLVVLFSFLNQRLAP